MENNEEYIAISKHFKGELWSSVKESLTKDGLLVEVNSDTYKSNMTGSIYKFVISGRGKDKYVTRIEAICDGDVVNSFQKTCEPKEDDVDDKNDNRTRKEIRESMDFELGISSCVLTLNDYWKSYTNQNNYYRKNKEKVDKMIQAYKSTGFDFSRNVTEDDALKVGEYYCVIEFDKRTNNKRLYKTIETGGKVFYFYKAKADDAPSCIFSGLFVKCMMGEDVFESLKCCHKYKIY